MLRDRDPLVGSKATMWRKAVPIGVWVVLSIWQIYCLSFSGALYAPPEAGDGPDYDSIALNLARGRGFGFFPSNPEWRSAYDSHGDKYNSILSSKGDFELTTYRPPILPSILAITYSTVGRKFWIWRVVQAFLISGGIVLTALTAGRLFGLWSALFVVLFACSDPILFPLAAGEYLTEGLSFFLVSVLLALVLTERPLGSNRFIGAGLISGLLVLTRTVFFIWLPLICIGILFQKPFKRSVRRSLLFLIAAFVLVFPWMVRNCVVSKSFLPLGSQGAINLPQAYSDFAYARSGVWSSKTHAAVLGTFQSVSLELPYETELAQHASGVSRAWLKEHWTKVPHLMVLKMQSLWWKQALPFQHLLIILACLGLAISYQKRMFQVVFVSLALLMAHTLAVALTWTVGGGRFLIPLHPLLYIFGSLSLAYVLEQALSRWRKCY